MAIVIRRAAAFLMLGLMLFPAATVVMGARDRGPAREKSVAAVEEKREQPAPVEVREGNEQRTGAKEDAALPGREFKDEDFRPKVEEESYVWMVFKTIIVMGFLVGGFYYFFRFVTKKAGIPLIGGNAAQVLSVMPLGQNKFIHVVDLAGRILVLGVADANINLITEITDKHEIDRLRVQSARRPAEGEAAGSFQDYVFRQIGRVVERIQGATTAKSRDDAVRQPRDFGHEEHEGRDGLDYLKRQKHRLKDMNGDGHHE